MPECVFKAVAKLIKLTFKLNQATHHLMLWGNRRFFIKSYLNLLQTSMVLIRLKPALFRCVIKTTFFTTGFTQKIRKNYNTKNGFVWTEGLKTYVFIIHFPIDVSLEHIDNTYGIWQWNYVKSCKETVLLQNDWALLAYPFMHACTHTTMTNNGLRWLNIDNIIALKYIQLICMLFEGQT